MGVEEIVKEAKKGLDNLIPVTEKVQHDYHQINVTIPQPVIRFEWPNGELNYGDIVAGMALVLGFISLGMAIKGI
jgi:hypothetical protein